MTPLNLKGRAALPEVCHIVFDEYVPIQFATYDEPLGAGYLRLGGEGSLLELAVEPRRQVLRGLTLTAMSELSAWPRFQVAPVVSQLPVVQTDFDAYDVVELPIPFRVAVDSDQVVVWWSELAQSARCGFERASFLLENDAVVGALFTGVPSAHERMRAHLS